MNFPEELKHINVQLDSETAKQIADEWITYCYVDMIAAWLFGTTVVLSIAFGISWVVRRMTRIAREESEARKKAFSRL